MPVTLVSCTFCCPQLHAPLFKRSAGAYSYQNADYPFKLSLEVKDPVALTLHESIHFALNNSDSIATQEWVNLVSWPEGLGRVRLGPQHRVFLLSMYHQLHCLWSISMSLSDTEHPFVDGHHLQHCLHYLRQTFLCEAADSLEAGDFLSHEYPDHRVQDTLVCRDWEALYRQLEGNYEDWLRWNENWN